MTVKQTVIDASRMDKIEQMLIEQKAKSSTDTMSLVSFALIITAAGMASVQVWVALAFFVLGYLGLLNSVREKARHTD